MTVEEVVEGDKKGWSERRDWRAEERGELKNGVRRCRDVRTPASSQEPRGRSSVLTRSAGWPLAQRLDGVVEAEIAPDTTLDTRRNLNYSTTTSLRDAGFAVYDRCVGTSAQTELGSVASFHFMIGETRANATSGIIPTKTDEMNDPRASLTPRNLQGSVSARRRLEVGRVLDRVQYPVHKNVDDHTCKITVLM